MAKRLPKSSNEPRFMQDQEFEQEAALLLAEYGNQHGHVLAPPVPIDEIVEEHVKLAIQFKDLKREYPEGDVLGAIWFSKKLIDVDLSLCPEDFPAMLGRYRFTVAHELGHWRLHRHLYLRRNETRPLLPSAASAPDHVFRDRASDPKEIQANRFAASLLMPREMVKRVWHEWQGSMDPLFLSDLRIGLSVQSDDSVLDGAAKPLAEVFQVSPNAMRIRLEELKLLQRTKEATLF